MQARSRLFRLYRRNSGHIHEQRHLRDENIILRHFTSFLRHTLVVCHLTWPRFHLGAKGHVNIILRHTLVVCLLTWPRFHLCAKRHVH